MDISYFNIFLTSTYKIFETILNVRPKRLKSRIKKFDEPSLYDVSGTITLDGDITASISIAFPKEIALKIVEIILGEKDLDLNDPLVDDGISEFINMIAGDAKTDFISVHGINYELILPLILKGENHVPPHPQGMTVILTEFTLDGIGDFSLEIGYNE